MCILYACIPGSRGPAFGDRPMCVCLQDRRVYRPGCVWVNIWKHVSVFVSLHVCVPGYRGTCSVPVCLKVTLRLELACIYLHVHAWCLPALYTQMHTCVSPTCGYGYFPAVVCLRARVCTCAHVCLPECVSLATHFCTCDPVNPASDI